ncbi:MAG: BglG family transcription antiterminator [Erysipelotrichaceae bacterium]|nr:BglG family transcription antiterminator [Erysipelotrichaceae bacterium]
MNFDPRMKKILLELLKDEYLSISQLAERVGVSKRTIQRELGYIDDDLRPYNLVFQSKTGKGVWLEGSQENKLELYSAIEKDNTFDSFDAKNRQRRILLELLKSQDIHKIISFANLINVSEATIRLDLMEIEKWLDKFDLVLEKTPGLGVRMSGSEANLRRAIRAYFSDFAPESSGSGRFDEIKEFMVKNREGISQLLDEDILKRVIECLEDISSDQIRELTESSYIGLIIHLAIVVKRIQSGEQISYDRDLLKSIDIDQDYRIAKLIGEFLMAEFDIVIDEMELYYINLHLKGTKHQTMNIENIQMDNEVIKRLINKMIDAYDPAIAFELKQDDHFINGLLTHLQPTLIRIVNDMVITNPLLDQIKKQYPREFEKCLNVGQVLEDFTHKKVPSGEIGFLAMHFGSAGIRLKLATKKARRVNVGVICATGIGLSRLMGASLEKIYGDRIRVFPFSKADAFSADVIDFYLSSIKMDGYHENLLYVNPILNDQDLDAIGALIEKHCYLPVKNTTVQDSFIEQLSEFDYYVGTIKYILENIRITRIRADCDFGGLVARSTDSMDETMAATVRHDLIAREKIGSQIFKQLSFGLLHTKTNGVERPQIILILPESGPAFVDDYLAGVKVVICLLMPKNEYENLNSNILGHISSVLVEDESIIDVFATGQKQEIVEKLSLHFKTFLAKNLL